MHASDIPMPLLYVSLIRPRNFLETLHDGINSELNQETTLTSQLEYKLTLAKWFCGIMVDKLQCKKFYNSVVKHVERVLSPCHLWHPSYMAEFTKAPALFYDQW